MEKEEYPGSFANIHNEKSRAGFISHLSRSLSDTRR